MMKLRHTLLLDLSNALKQTTDMKDAARTLTVLELYREMGGVDEAIKVLKNPRNKY